MSYLILCRSVKMSFLKCKTIYSSTHGVFLRCLSTNPHLYGNKLASKSAEHFSSKQVRELFLKYFIDERNHTYVQSSPVFLNNDPSLLFVNAGMNQFKSLLLNKTFPGHPFHGLKNAANSQKCIRLSGKHNDLKDVGADFYHHTFFEMLGNWSFGDYTKLDACKMAWELLTNVYGLNPQNLYVTYFGGDQHLGIPLDEECKKIWHEIGVHPNHIFPFGSKDNFWEMGDTGPCGPCTEIHYDFLSSGHEVVAKKINSGSSDVMEIWNLVFIQYNRGKDMLNNLPVLNVDTGMGFERLTAVLQGTRSNYDTDIFSPIFKAIESNFNVRPYQGKTGPADVDGLDTAYRILADHSRMFSVAIADGLFPDTYDAGHVLRKIIRRAAYSANRVMKTRPGALSSLVHYVAETLDFFPEIGKHIDQIVYVVNDEEKMLHHVVNMGRRTRNKMAVGNAGKILNGNEVFELHEVHGLEDNVIQDLASEINLAVDWDGYNRVKKEKKQLIKKEREEKANAALGVANILSGHNVPLTDDHFKYNSCTDKTYGVKNITAKVVAIFKKDIFTTDAEKGNHCMLLTDKSNFYSESGGQVSDIGKIYSKDFTFQVENVSSSHGYVFHHGVVAEGKIECSSEAHLEVDQEHRLSCSRNHTATHILNAALRKVLPYTAQRSSLVGPTHLNFGFSAKSHLTLDQLETIENFANLIIDKNCDILRKELKFEELMNHPNVILLRGEEYPDIVSVICIKNEDGEISSVEPCCGTHVNNTADIESILIIPSKTHSGSVKYLTAVTGKQATLVKENGRNMSSKVLDLKQSVDSTLGKVHVPLNTYLDLLKQVKNILRECQLKLDAPLRVLRDNEEILKDLKLKLTDVINSASKSDMQLDPSGAIVHEMKHSQVLNDLRAKNIVPTNDCFKYDYCSNGVKPISAKVIALIYNDKLVDSVERGLSCQLILDQTNLYAKGDDQAGDEGMILHNDFAVKIIDAYKIDGYIFHDGIVQEGIAVAECNVNVSVNKEHRLACSQNHTALHILNTVMMNELPYFFPQSGNAGSKELELLFTSKGKIPDPQLEDIETKVNECIRDELNVVKSQMSLKSLKEMPLYKSALVQECQDYVPIVTIGNNTGSLSSEPCSGTHVTSTKEIGSFIITTQKNVKNKERVIRAVTGEAAKSVQNNGDFYDHQMSQLEQHVSNCLEKSQLDMLELWDCLKSVKEAKAHHYEVPLLMFRRHQDKFIELTRQLTMATKVFVQDGLIKAKEEMENVLRESSEDNFIVHKLLSIGDGKRIVNYAIENSIDKPALYFAQDGLKTIICSCCVPKSFVNSEFSALLWINPVATLLEGQTRALTTDPELFYSVTSKRMDTLDQAISLAKETVKTLFKP